MEKIQIKTKDGVCEAFEFKNKGPNVLMYMDAIGLRPAFLKLAQRIADEGFHVITPQLFYRDHTYPIIDYPASFTGEQLGEFFPKVKSYMANLTAERLVSDAEAYLNHFEGPVSIIGYCFGGGHALRTAAQYPTKVNGVVSLHAGNLALDKEDSPLHLLNKIKCPLYFGHADQDKSMPLEMIQKLDNELKRLNKNFYSEIYTGAAHGFTQTDLPAFEPKASEKSFQKTISELKKFN